MEILYKNAQMTDHLQPIVIVIVLRLLGVIFLLDTAMAFVIVSSMHLITLMSGIKPT
jgi:hypothetical protein